MMDNDGPAQTGQIGEEDQASPGSEKVMENSGH